MSKNDGGPAFPFSALEPDPETRQLQGSIYKDNEGMTLRDWFATWHEPSIGDITILLEYNRDLNPHNDGPPKPKRISREEAVCILKYRFADAMLKAREE